MGQSVRASGAARNAPRSHQPGKQSGSWTAGLINFLGLLEYPVKFLGRLFSFIPGVRKASHWLSRRPPWLAALIWIAAATGIVLSALYATALSASIVLAATTTQNTAMLPLLGYITAASLTFKATMVGIMASVTKAAAQFVLQAQSFFAAAPIVSTATFASAQPVASTPSLAFIAQPQAAVPGRSFARVEAPARTIATPSIDRTFRTADLWSRMWAESHRPARAVRSAFPASSLA